MQRQTFRFLLIVLLATAVSLAACGGQAPAPAAPTEAPAAAPTQAPAAAPATQVPAPPPTEAPAGGGDGARDGNGPTGGGS
ncbi:MAG: hypothetical protein M5U01_18580 [Ardenticatenaceae bacterium]|nr:hypothetical protein [Ardenticatenaceae bacterium]